MNKIVLGTGHSFYGYEWAHNQAYNQVSKNFGEDLSQIHKWCEENIPNSYEFFREKYEDNPMDRGVICRISVSLLTSEATTAFKLRWI